MQRLTIGVLLALAVAVVPALAQQGQQGQPGQQQQGPQIELQNGELQQFVSVLQEVQEVQSQAQQDMQSSLEDEGMSQQRFSEIHRNQQQSSDSGSGSGDISQSEQESYQTVLSDLQEIRQQTSEEIQQLIQDEGFSMQRFNAIYRAVQSRPELQQRVQDLMSSSS